MKTSFEPHKTMNTYFCSTQKSNCPENCNYQFCSEKHFYGLKTVPSLSGIERIVCSSLLKPCSESTLRSGDLIILYVETRQELDSIVTKRELLESFQLVLIMDQDLYQNNRSCHLLAPRFITTIEQNTNNLIEVVQRLTDKRSRKNLVRKNYETGQLSAEGTK